MDMKILLVDDEPNVLETFKRQLINKFTLDTAPDGIEGLKCMASRGPFAVIVSDMRMPGMDGIQFLHAVKLKSPDTVRVILTGDADLQSAIDAVNKGAIFRFLTKPCPQELLISTIQAGIDQYRMITAERELLEETLNGSVKILMEILGLVNPTAFGHTMRVRSYVKHIVKRLNLPGPWQFELAAMLSMIGCVTLPPDTLDKLYAGMPLDENEQKIFNDHPTVARNLLQNIPRMGTVARMIEVQNQPYARLKKGMDFEGEDMVALGGHIIKVATTFDRLMMRGKTTRGVLNILTNRTDEFLPEVVAVMGDLAMGQVNQIEKNVYVRDLNTSMVLSEDVIARNGVLIAGREQEVSYTMLQRLRAFDQSIGVKEPFRVIVKTPTPH